MHAHWGANDAQALQMDALDQVWPLDIKTGDKTNIAHDTPLIDCRAKPRDAISTRHFPDTKCDQSASYQSPHEFLHP